MKRIFILLPLLAFATAAVAWVFHKRAGKTIPLPTDSGDPPWAAIDEAFQRVYPDQKNPKHFANPIPKQLGGPSHLDGFAVYETDDCYHIVTLGLSAAFTEDENAKRTGVCGMEFSLKLRKASLRSGNEEAVHAGADLEDGHGPFGELAVDGDADAGLEVTVVAV